MLVLVRRLEHLMLATAEELARILARAPRLARAETLEQEKALARRQAMALLQPLE